MLPGVQRSSRAGEPLLAPRLAIGGAIGIALFSILLLRLWALTVLGGAEYAARADSNQIRRLPVEAPRGSILDRTGKHALLSNRGARQVVLDLQDVDEADRPRLYAGLARVLDMTVPEVEARVRRGSPDPLAPIVIAEDVEREDVVWYLVEHQQDFPGVDIRVRYTRDYVAGTTAAHLLGQVGEVEPDQLKGEHANLRAGDRVGQSGLERIYDEYLRGVDGYEAYEVDAAGVRKGEGRGAPATPGRNLVTTLDLELQQATESALIDGVKIARRASDGSGRSADAAAAVAIDVKTGEILSMGSYPTFNPDIFVSPGHDREINRVFNDRKTPMLNRAVEGLYPPGSTFKPVTGIAAMQEHFVGPAEPLPCPGSYEVAGSTFNNWTPLNLAAMDMPHALEASCDTYFYRLAVKFYNDPGTPLQDWSRKLGLGAASGIDLPGEQSGTVPDERWLQKTFGADKRWSPGMSVNMSIGQGDLLVTPLQMTRIYAAIANGGDLIEPRLGKRIVDAAGKDEVVLPAGERKHIDIPAGQLEAIRNGLFLAANGPNGTSTAVFDGFSVPVAGKTGTAEKAGAGDMAWYCGYAPADDPEIAACAMVEKGGHGGTSAAPIVLKMFQQWFDAKGGSTAGQVSD